MTIILSLLPLFKSDNMSVLESIRKRTGLLVGIVGLAIILFILQLSMGNGGMGSIFGGGDNENSVGTIDGISVDARVFQEKVAKLKEDLSRGQQPSEQVNQQAINQAWEDLIREMVIEKEYKKLGIEVSNEELYDQMLVHPHQIIVNQFRDQQTQKINPPFGNPDGSLNVQELNKLVAGFQPDQEKMWKQIENYVRQQRMTDKYVALIKGGLYTTAIEAQMSHEAQNRNIDARFVFKKLADIADKDIKFDDNDLKQYYDSHQYEFQNENPSRSIEYIVWEVIPSKADIDSLTAELSRMKPEFSAGELSEDSAYTQAINTTGMADVSSFTKDKLSPEIDSSFYTSPIKTVFGPFKDGNSFKLIKMRGTETVSDSGRVRHILIAKANPRSQDVKRSPEQAKKMADSLKDILVKDRKKWDEFCEKFSDDPGKKRPDIKSNPELIKNKQAFPTGDTNKWTGKGGDYGWVNESSGYVPEFKSFALTGKTGQINVVPTDFGYHIMEILETSKSQKKKYKIATISRELRPSDVTRQNFLTQASEFAGQNNTAETFNKAVDAKKLNKRVNDDLKESDMYLPGFQSQTESPKQLVREVYKGSAGQVLAPIVIGDKIVVTHIKKIKEKGTLPFEVVKEEVTTKVKDMKKAEKILSDFNTKLKSSKGIDDFAAKTGLTVEKAEKIQFNSYSVPKFGNENELIATMTSIKKGELKAGKGSTGVWVVQVDNVIDAEKIKDIKALQKNYSMGFGSRAQYEPTEALKKLANIEDHKARFDF